MRTSVALALCLCLQLCTASLSASAQPLPSVHGGPQFVGLLGQSYQIHGVDGQVYNLVSDKLVQVNAKLSFLDAGACDKDEKTGAPLYTCWSHSGTYITAIGLRTAAGDSVIIRPGKGWHGFDSMEVNGLHVPIHSDDVEWPIVLSSADVRLPPLTIALIDRRTLAISHAGLYSLVLENSDAFMNIMRLEVSDPKRLKTEVRSHGLIGQTWQRRTNGLDVAPVEGSVDDYVLAWAELLGCTFLYNKHECGR